MKSRASLVVAYIALLLFGLASPAHAQDIDTAVEAVDTINAVDAMDDAMRDQVESGQVSGVIGLIEHDGKIVYSNAFGNAVLEEPTAMNDETLFRIFSMTKPIVAVTAMSLWEEGKFKLDDPISNYLPEWTNATVMEDGKTVPVKKPITPRDLMTHSAGISYDRDGLALSPNDTLEQFSESMAKRPLEFEPGTDFRYGYSIDILGRYIEAITGQTLDVVMRDRVLDPLGMNDTEFWAYVPDARARAAVVYTKTKEGKLQPVLTQDQMMVKPSRMMGGQGLISTSADYAKFCKLLLNKGEVAGSRVLKTETVELMFENHLKDIDKVYGLGGMVDGKGEYSWGGAAGTKFWIDSERNAYGVFMVQTWGYEAPTYGIFRKLANQIIAE